MNPAKTPCFSYKLKICFKLEPSISPFCRQGYLEVDRTKTERDLAERQTDTHGRTDRADKQTMQINKTHSVKELHLEKIKDRNGDRNPHRVYI